MSFQDTIDEENILLQAESVEGNTEGIVVIVVIIVIVIIVIET